MQSEKMRGVWESDVRDVVAHRIPWGKFSGCRILVSGANGFLGSNLVRVLVALHRLGLVDEPVQVVVMVRDSAQCDGRFGALVRDSQLEVVEWDFRSIGVPQIGSCQYIVHAASHASPRFYVRDPVGTLLPNTVGTAVLLEAMQQQSSDPQGFLFVSSSEIYGAVNHAGPLLETDYGILDPVGIRACYAESKRMGETICAAWENQYGIPAFIVRPFHTYGPGIRPDDGRVFADFVFNVVNDDAIRIAGDGTPRRAFCYASDAIAGFFTVLLKGESSQPYNVGNPRGELSVMELAELIVRIFPERSIRIDRQRPVRGGSAHAPPLIDRVVPNIDKLSALGWLPSVSPEVGFRRTIEAYGE